MEIRYLGFDQRQNARVYRFDVRMDGRLTKQVSVTADIAVFRNHSVAIQEGPSLSGNKLTADLERGWEGEHEGNWGVSHLLEHVLFRDKQLNDEMSYLQLIKEAGGSANGETRERDERKARSRREPRPDP